MPAWHGSPFWLITVRSAAGPKVADIGVFAGSIDVVVHVAGDTLAVLHSFLVHHGLGGSFVAGLQVVLGQGAHIQVGGLVNVYHRDVTLADVHRQQLVAALAVLGQVIQAQGLQRGALLPIDLLNLAAVAVIADASVAEVHILDVVAVAGVSLKIGVEDDRLVKFS